MPSTRPLLDFYLKYFEDKPEDIEDGLHDSFVPPNSYWTAWEKEIFFDALRRHSRLRPELIQEEIGDTKSVWEVCSYINLLDATSSSKESTSIPYASTSAAVEMSENWVAFENRQAAALVAYEDYLLGNFYRNKVREEKTSDQNPEPITGKWKSRRVLRHLDTGKLAVLDYFLGDADQPTGDAINSPSRSYTPPIDSNRESSPAASNKSATQRESTPFDLSSMTVAERKRWRNRIYMRRKRAKLSGHSADESTEKLKPGRKRKLKLKSARKRGFVNFEKTKALLDKAGITSEHLQSLDMDIFRLTTFGKLSE